MYYVLSHDMNYHHCGSMINHFLYHVTFKSWVDARVF